MEEDEDTLLTIGMALSASYKKKVLVTAEHVEKAHEIARKAHAGQVDKAGRDYIKHPETVASFVSGNTAKAIAYLHDVLEDTALTAEDLLAEDIPLIVVDAVSLLTHDKNEPYFDYLARVKKNELARRVKLVDLRHNSDLSRLENPTAQDFARLEKYHQAQKFLEEEND